MESVESRCRALLADIEIPRPFDLSAFCAALVERRDRDLILEPVSFGGKISGLWLRMQDEDIVYYEKQTSVLHQRHIIVHELAHMILDHPHDPSSSLRHRAELAPLIDLDAYDALYTRTDYRSVRELEAETLATLVLSVDDTRRPPKGEQQATRTALTRAEEVFG